MKFKKEIGEEKEAAKKIAKGSKAQTPKPKRKMVLQILVTQK